MSEYERESEKVSPFDIDIDKDNKVSDAVRAALEGAGLDASVLENAPILVLIPQANGQIYFGFDEEVKLSENKLKEIQSKGVIPQFLTSVAIFVGKGCQITWTYVGGALTILEHNCDDN